MAFAGTTTYLNTIFITRFWGFSRENNPLCFPMRRKEFCTRAIPELRIALWFTLTTRTCSSIRICVGHVRRRKLVMRGGFGMFYDIEDGALIFSLGACRRSQCCKHLQHGAHLISGYNRDPIADPFTPRRYQRLSVSPRGRGDLRRPENFLRIHNLPHFRTPYSETSTTDSNGSTKDTMVEAVYVGSLGRRLISTAETNYPIPSVEKYSWHSMDSSMKIARVR